MAGWKVIIRINMVEDTLENIWMIKNMDMENFIGLMEEFIKVNGKMENNMEEENTKELITK